MSSENRGYVYVLSNPSMPGILKIGRSKNGGQGRASTFYKNDTAVPTPFVLEFEVETAGHTWHETEIHKALRESRVHDKREFFRVSVERAIFIVKEQIKQTPPVIPNKSITPTGSENVCDCGCQRIEFGVCPDCYDDSNIYPADTERSLDELRVENMRLRNIIERIAGCVFDSHDVNTQKLLSQDIAELVRLARWHTAQFSDESFAYQKYSAVDEYLTDDRVTQSVVTRIIKLAYCGAIDLTVDQSGKRLFRLNRNSLRYIDQHQLSKGRNPSSGGES